ncbi:hypothetical protein ACFQIA_02005 [Halalkalicoccus sp. GCM10025704]
MSEAFAVLPGRGRTTSVGTEALRHNASVGGRPGGCMRKAASRCAGCGNVYPAEVDGEVVTPIRLVACSRCGGRLFTEIDANALFGDPVTE